MTEQLTEGLYVIRSSGDAGLFLGGVIQPGIIGAPQRIDSLPEGVLPPHWHIHKFEDGAYGLSVRGVVTFPMNEKIYGLPLPHDHAYKWRIERQPQHGPNAYTITSFTEPDGKGWVLPSKEAYTQVEFRPLIATKSFPPKYPESELFTIVRIPLSEV